MTRLLIQRALWGVVTLFLVSVLVFAGTAVLSGDAATIALGKQATPERVAALRATLGLDDPAPVRYFDWLTGLFQGDLGVSLSVGTAGSTTDVSTDNRAGLPVSELVGDRLVNSMILAFAAAAVVFPLSLLLAPCVLLSLPFFEAGLVPLARALRYLSRSSWSGSRVVGRGG